MQASLALSSVGRGARAASPTASGCWCSPWRWSSRIFAAIGENFFTLANFFEVVRLSVELGLLALALTPIMITGGIDLSVGSIMGLSAVVFGVLWRDGGWPIAGGGGRCARCWAAWRGC